MSVWDLSIWIALVDCVVTDYTRGSASRAILRLHSQLEQSRPTDYTLT